MFKAQQQLQVLDVCNTGLSPAVAQALETMIGGAGQHLQARWGSECTAVSTAVSRASRASPAVSAHGHRRW